MPERSIQLAYCNRQGFLQPLPPCSLPLQKLLASAGDSCNISPMLLEIVVPLEDILQDNIALLVTPKERKIHAISALV
jgi:hypothetical protein